jgi:hypothetical protein
VYTQPIEGSLQRRVAEGLHRGLDVCLLEAMANKGVVGSVEFLCRHCSRAAIYSRTAYLLRACLAAQLNFSFRTSATWMPAHKCRLNVPAIATRCFLGVTAWSVVSTAGPKAKASSPKLHTCMSSRIL